MASLPETNSDLEFAPFSKKWFAGLIPSKKKYLLISGVNEVRARWFCQWPKLASGQLGNIEEFWLVLGDFGTETSLCE